MKRELNLSACSDGELIAASILAQAALDHGIDVVGEDGADDGSLIFDVVYAELRRRAEARAELARAVCCFCGKTGPSYPGEQFVKTDQGLAHWECTK